VLLDQTVLKQGTVKEVYKSPEFEQIFSIANEEAWVKEEEKHD
jgi:hypothetical protein